MVEVRKKKSSSLGPILLVVFLAVSILFTTLWYRESHAGPLHNVRRVVSIVTTPVMQAGRWVFTPATRLSAWVGSLSVNTKDARKLAAENTNLRSTVMQLEESRLEAERLRKLLDVKSALELKSTGARVIGTSVDNYNDAILINKGTKDGIEEGMAVVSELGLVGKVVDASPFIAAVQLIDDVNSGAAAMVQSSRTEGIINGGGEGNLRLNFISKEITVKPGDVVITSGLGGTYPKGVVIGEVRSVDKESGGVYQVINVKPAVDTARIEEVLVIVGGSDIATGGAK